MQSDSAFPPLSSQPVEAAPQPPPYGARAPRIPTAFTEECKPLDHLTLSAVADALLKRPGRLAYELTRGNAPAARSRLLAIGGACLALYGLAMGCFSGGHQLWFVPLKVAAGAVLSALLCLPSLYVFTALAGGRLVLREVWGLLVMAIALASMLLVGFAPVAWLFAESTRSAAWMGFLHLLFWLAALGFGFRVLRQAFEFLNGRRAGVLHLWAVVFLAVVLQMSTCLRPLVGPYRGLDFGDKKFFVAHWVDGLD